MRAVTKTASIATALVVGIVYIYGLKQPDDMIFLLISNNSLANIGWLIVSALSIYLCFTSYFRNLWQRVAYGTLGTALLAMGLSGVFIEQLNDPSHVLLKPLNFVLAMGLGLLFISATIAYSHAPALGTAKAKQLIPSPWREFANIRSLAALIPDLILRLYPFSSPSTTTRGRSLLPKPP